MDPGRSRIMGVLACPASATHLILLLDNDLRLIDSLDTTQLEPSYLHNPSFAAIHIYPSESWKVFCTVSCESPSETVRFPDRNGLNDINLQFLSVVEIPDKYMNFYSKC